MVTYPKDWKECRLDEISVINPHSEVPQRFKYVDLESVKGVSLLNTRIEYKATAPSRAQRHATVGDIFFQTVRPYQRNNFFFDRTEDDYVFSTGYAQIRTDYDSKFLFYVLQKDPFVEEVINNCTGTSYPAINPKKLGAIQVCIPLDVAEQRAIAATLSTFDTHIDNLTALIEKKKAIRNGAIADLMSGRTRLEGFSGEWEEYKTRDIAVSFQNGTFSEIDRKGIGIPFINVSDLYGTVPIDKSALELFNANESEVSRFCVKNGDLFFTRSSIVPEGVAMCNFFDGNDDGDVVFDSHLIKMTIDKNMVYPKFICLYYRNDACRNYFISHSKSATMTTIDQNNIADCPILLPSLDEQKAIAGILTSMDTEIQNLEIERDKFMQIREGAMDDLLTGRVRLPLEG